MPEDTRSAAWLHEDLPGALFRFEGANLRALNHAARRLLGFDGQNDAPADALARIEHALDPQGLLRQRLQDADFHTRAQPLRLSSRHRNGQSVGLELQVEPVGPGTLVLAHDCSRWRDIEHQLQRKLAFERLITEALASLIRSSNETLDEAITAVLGSVGQFFAVDRAYVFLFDEEAQTQSNTHEWVAPGISHEAHNLQDIPLDTFPWLLGQMRADQVFQVGRIADMPAEAVNERAEFEREGIQSILIVPLRRGAGLHGFVGFDSVRQLVDWDEHYVLGLRLMAQMLASVLEARNLSQRLHHQAFHDALTGLPNRMLLQDRFGQAVARVRREGGCLLLAVVDVDDFKRINDGHGHAVGDLALCEVARRLRATVRDVDTVARMGGDEFVVLVQNEGSASPAELARRLLDACVKPMSLDGAGEVAAGISIGLVVVDSPRMATTQADFENLLNQADAAMYQAKAGGKRQWVIAK